MPTGRWRWRRRNSLSRSWRGHLRSRTSSSVVTLDVLGMKNDRCLVDRSRRPSIMIIRCAIETFMASTEFSTSAVLRNKSVFYFYFMYSFVRSTAFLLLQGLCSRLPVFLSIIRHNLGDQSQTTQAFGVCLGSFRIYDENRTQKGLFKDIQSVPSPLCEPPWSRRTLAVLWSSKYILTWRRGRRRMGVSKRSSFQRTSS